MKIKTNKKKNTMKNTVIIICSLMLFSGYCYSQTIKQDSTICLEIKGKVTNIKSKSDDSYKIELIYYNTVVKNDTLSATKSFMYSLKKNAIYSIRISKKGYLTKLISIYTKIPKENQELYRLDFDTELIEEHKSKKLNSDAIDFPITIIYFDEEENLFYFNEEYTNNIKKCLYNVKVVRNKI
jgi:hypothetical protein